MVMLLDWCSSILQSTFLSILKYGEIPEHVAFIMDGNRRFATKNKMEKEEGHSYGFQSLENSLEILLNLGVKVVTVYAFSIENFKRPKKEVDTIMNLARSNFTRLIENEEMFDKLKIKFNVFGNTEMLPEDVREVMNNTVNKTKHNDGAILNVCAPYTSRNEICKSMKEIVEETVSGKIKTEQITQEVLESHFYTKNVGNPDILVRTSGESRLSDFLLWQAQESQIMFFNVLWPEFSWPHLAGMILLYQNKQKQKKEEKINLFNFV